MGFNNGFDFGYTCPDINKSIDALKSDIESHIDNMIDILCPILGAKERNTLIKEYVEEFYSSFEKSIEDIRSTNQDMRDAAEKQISDIINEKSNLEDEIKDLELKVSELESEINAA